MDGDNVAMLDTEVVPHDTVHACAPVIEVVVCQHDQNGISALLTLYQNCVTSEEL